MTKDIPLLLIHGYPFDHTMWFSTIAALGAKAKVVAPDLPGFGKTPVLENVEPSIDAYAKFLIDYLDENMHETVAVAGMSMGGYIALALAEKYPDRICGLGLISTQAAADSPEAKQARKEMIHKIREHGPSVAAEAIIPKMFANEQTANIDLKTYPQEGAEKAGREGLTWALEAMAARPDRTELISSVTCPVLIVHGSEDKIIPIAKARALAEKCQKPLLFEIHNAGHATPLEAPDQVATALARFIKTSKESLPPEPNPS